MRLLQYCLALIVISPLAFAQELDGVSAPEPGTAVLMALGVAGLGFAAWRRGRNE